MDCLVVGRPVEYIGVVVVRYLPEDDRTTLWVLTVDGVNSTTYTNGAINENNRFQLV